MVSVISISLPEHLLKWLNGKKEGRSPFIRRILENIKQEEISEDPQLIRKELEEIEKRRKILLDKIRAIEKEKRTKREQEIKIAEIENKQLVEKEQCILETVSQIPQIDVLLRPAIEGKEFDYMKLVDKLIQKGHKVDFISLRKYVQHKQKKSLRNLNL